MESLGRRKTATLIFPILLISIGIIVGVVVTSQMNWQPVGQADNEGDPPMVSGRSTLEGELTFMEVAKVVTPAVVNISSTRVIKNPGGGQTPFFNDPFFRRFFGDEFFRQFELPPQRREQSLGSGVIVDPRGYIVTNNHVVELATEITVVLGNRQEFKGELVGNDPKTDIAVIKVKSDQDLPFAAWGDSDQLQVGEYVLAIGNPFGLNQTVTMGIISAVGRANVGIADYEDFIQTDAAINPGNSGGALVDTKGEVIGINTAIFTRSGGYQGIGFAVPSNMARKVMESLISSGKVVRGWLGVSIQEINPELGKQFGVEELKGALVGDVFPDSPAEQSGLERGDVILKFDGKGVNSVGQLRNWVAQTAVGNTVKLEILRDRQKKTLKVKIGELPKDLAEAPSQGKKPEIGVDNVLSEVEVQDLSPDIIRQLELPKGTSGVIISHVPSGTPAEEAGLKRGDVIQEINRQPIKGTSDYSQIVSKIEKNESVLLLILREGRTFFITVSP